MSASLSVSQEIIRQAFSSGEWDALQSSTSFQRAYAVARSFDEVDAAIRIGELELHCTEYPSNPSPSRT